MALFFVYSKLMTIERAKKPSIIANTASIPFE